MLETQRVCEGPGCEGPMWKTPENQTLGQFKQFKRQHGL